MIPLGRAGCEHGGPVPFVRPPQNELVLESASFNPTAMIHPSKVVSIHPYFKVKAAKWAEAKAALQEFVAKTSTEKGNLYYDFTISGDVIFCREAYVGAEGMLAHVQNVGATLAEFLKLVDIVRVEVHGSAEELAKLKAPLADLKPQWFEFERGVIDRSPALA